MNVVWRWSTPAYGTFGIKPLRLGKQKTACEGRFFAGLSMIRMPGGVARMDSRRPPPMPILGVTSLSKISPACIIQPRQTSQELTCRHGNCKRLRAALVKLWI